MICFWLCPGAWEAGKRAGEHAAAAGQWWWGALAGLGLLAILPLLVLAVVWSASQDD